MSKEITYEKAIQLIQKVYPGKSRKWAEDGLDRAIRNTDIEFDATHEAIVTNVSPDLIAAILEVEFGIEVGI